jgi:nucleoside-triphosphatase THEP1
MKRSDRRVINAEIIRANAGRIVLDPSLVIDRLSVNKPVFTKEEIATVLTSALLEIKSSSGNKIGNLVGEEDLELLNLDLANEFMIAYGAVLASPKLSLVVEEDLKGRSLYARTDRIELEKKYMETVESLHESYRHGLHITEEQLGEKSVPNRLMGGIKNVAGYLEQVTGIDLGIELEKELSSKQKQAVLELLNGRDLVVLEGLPGSGKSTVMGEIVRQYQKSGFRVIGAAPSSSAALNLSSLAGIEAKNTAQWRKIWQEEAGEKFELALRSDYYKEKQYAKDKKCRKSSLSNFDVLIIDEASMMELANMDYMLSEAKKAGAKVILVGDNNQFAAVGMQGAMAHACKVAQVSRLSEVRRQRNRKHTRATELLGQYKIAEALSIYREQNCFAVHKDEKTAKSALVSDYITAYLVKAQKQGRDDLVLDKSIVICAYTNEAVSGFNLQVREKLKQAGVLRGRGEVVRLGGRAIELLIGEQIVFEQNSKRYEVLNGEVGTVLAVRQGYAGHSLIKARVTKADGSTRVIELDSSKYNAINYGYAVTAYKLQGATVEQALVYYEPQVGYEAFNVMMTRHRDGVKLYAASDILENNLYRGLAKDAERAKELFEISNKGKDKKDKGKDEVKDKKKEDKNKKEEEQPLWLTGLSIGVSRRANLSFASSYGGMGLTKSDKILKEYIESHSLVVNYLREIDSRKRLMEKKSKIKSNSREHELWSKVLEHKDKRDEAALIIADSYDDFKERIVQLNLNFETIRKHAGRAEYDYFVANKEVTNSIAGNEHYRQLIQGCARNEVEQDDSEQFELSCKKLSEQIGEQRLEIKQVDKEIQELKGERYILEDGINHLNDFQEKLLPEFLSRIYKIETGFDIDSILAKWDKLVNEKGLEAAVIAVKRSLGILGDLKGFGFGSFVGFNLKRINAIVNAEELPNRLRQYEEAKSAIKEAKDLLSEKNYETEEKALITRKYILEQSLPNELEQRFIDAAAKATDWQEFVASELVKEAIWDYHDRNESMTQNQEKEKGMGKDGTVEEEGMGEETTGIAIFSSSKTKYRRSFRNRRSSRNTSEIFNRVNVKSQRISFEQVNQVLGSSDYEKFFRDYANSINPDGQIRKHGKRIMCGSLNMNLDNGLWTRFSTGEGGDIFYFIAIALGTGKREALELIAGKVGVVKSNSGFGEANKQITQTKEEAQNNTAATSFKEPRDEWLPYKTVPEGAESFSLERHIAYSLKDNIASGLFEYRNADDSAPRIQGRIL